VGVLNEVRPHYIQAAVRDAYSTNSAQNESKNYAGFPHITGMAKRPKMESADAVINAAMPTTNENNWGIYLTDNLQTLVSKWVSHLLRHAAATEKVAMTAQGNMDIADLIKWLHHDIKVQLTMADITQIAQHDLKQKTQSSRPVYATTPILVQNGCRPRGFSLSSYCRHSCMQ